MALGCIPHNPRNVSMTRAARSAWLRAPRGPGWCWGTSRTWCWTRRAPGRRAPGAGHVAPRASSRPDHVTLGAWVECGGSRTRPPREGDLTTSPLYAPLYWGACRALSLSSKRPREQLGTFQASLPYSQGQNLAVNVLDAACSLDSGAYGGVDFLQQFNQYFV